MAWITANRAWRRAHKCAPIHARPVEPDEAGGKVRTVDHVEEVLRTGSWLCVGVEGEPWQQLPDRVTARYEFERRELRQFSFDSVARAYQVLTPRPEITNWAAQVRDPEIDGFSIRPGYDPSLVLRSKPGGYVLKRDVGDPYRDAPDDVWLVQQSIFEKTYVLL